MSDNDTTRRRFLMVASAASAVGLAGCSNISGGTDDSGSDESMDDSESMDNETMTDEG